MNDGLTVLESHRADVVRIAATYGASNLRFVEPEDADDDDLFLLVDMDPARSLFDLVDLCRDLEALLERTVEVLAAASLSPRLREGVLARARPL